MSLPKNSIGRPLEALRLLEAAHTNACSEIEHAVSLNFRAFLLLQSIAANPSFTLRRHCKQIGVLHAGTLLYPLRILCGRGLIEKAGAHPDDKRTGFYALTPEGREWLSKNETMIAGALSAALCSYEVDELREVL